MVLEVHTTDQKKYEDATISKPRNKRLSVAEIAIALHEHLLNPLLPNQKESTNEAENLVGRDKINMIHLGEGSECCQYALALTCAQKVAIVRGRVNSNVTNVFLREVFEDCSKLSHKELLRVREQYLTGRGENHGCRNT